MLKLNTFGHGFASVRVGALSVVKATNILTFKASSQVPEHAIAHQPF